MDELISIQQWIPVTERLPDTQDWVNVTVVDESGEVTADQFCDLVDIMPTADVVEVVRCRDCKHRGYIVKDRRGYEWIEYEETSHCPLQCYDDDYYNRLSEDDFFCADGERKNDG